MKLLFKNKAILFSNNTYFFQNPNSLEIIDVLVDRGYEVYMFVETPSFPVPVKYNFINFLYWKVDFEYPSVNIINFINNFKVYFKSFRFLKIKEFYYRSRILITNSFVNINILKENLKKIYYYFSLTLFDKNTVVIGFDETGFLMMNELTYFIKNKKIIYVSHEILFFNETYELNQKIKELFLKYINKIDLLIIPDSIREELLLDSFSNKINFFNQKKIYIPVGYRDTIASQTVRKKNYILYSGSVTEACKLNTLIELFKNKDESLDYKLHIHSYSKLNNFSSFTNNIIVSDEPITDKDDYIRFISGFGIALVLYYPDSDVGSHFGKNILEIGLSSGKLSLFCSQGIPVIFSPDKTFLKLKNSFDYGEPLWEFSDFFNIIGMIYENYDLYSRESRRLYEEVLNPVNGLNEFSKYLTRNLFYS